LKKQAAQERSTKRAKYSEEMRLAEVIAPLEVGSDVVQVHVMEAPVLQKKKKVSMFDELR
jgi:hypothetical protein